MFSANTSQVSADANWIEECFQSWLYTGNGSTQTITNGIDLAGKGGLVWVKPRNLADSHELVDTVRGADKVLQTNNTDATWNNAYSVSGFSSTGFTYNNGYGAGVPNYASWTFREQPKFFDVVTYTGNGANRTIAHNLGSVPGCIIVKRTDTTGAWQVYHRSLANTEYMVLNTTAAKATGATRWNSTTPTSTVFSVGTDATVNANGGTYVAYLFAHDAGGFGLTGTDNVISCGSFTTDGSGNATVDLGYEPQWVMTKRTNSTGGWNLYDNMRGWANGGDDQYLQANSSAAEQTFNVGHPTATGMYLSGNSASSDYIYIAIRRGPMKTPTDATKVFDPAAYTGAAAPYRTVSTAIKGGVDMVWNSTRDLATNVMYVMDRLRANQGLRTSSTTSEGTENVWQWDVSSGVNVRDGDGTSGYTYIDYAFKRAPGFFDVVCYTGTGSAQTLTHNLGATPELIITKNRTQANVWYTYSQATGATKYLRLNTNDAEATGANVWNNTAPTATQFTVGSSLSFASGDGFVAYLFASCPGVSKVGSYTGNGSSQTINCGFTGGARFVMIKRTNSTGDWYVFDSARGLTSGGDNSLLLNTTGAEDLYNNSDVNPESVGFSVGPTYQGLNASGATYIFLAIA